MVSKESYVERYWREKREAEEKAKKSRKKRKEVKEDGQNGWSEGQAAEEVNGDRERDSSRTES